MKQLSLDNADAGETLPWGEGLTAECELGVRDGGLFCAAHDEPFDPIYLT